MEKEEYTPEHFIGREDFLFNIQEWLGQVNPSSRLWAIVGAAGVGKSWLLNKVREELHRSNQPVFWLDLTLHPIPSPSYLNLTIEENRKQWLLSLAEQMNEICDLSTLLEDRDVTFDNLIDAFVLRLCDCELEPAPVFVIDGLDEISETEAQVLEDLILSNFLSRDCTRILLAYRDEYWHRNDHLRREINVQRLPVFTDQEKQTQLTHWENVANPFHIETLQKSLLSYQWNHPYLNSLLLQLTQHNNLVAFSAEHLRRCIEEVSQPAILNPTIFELLNHLVHVNPKDDSWTAKHVRDKLNMGIDDPALLPLFDAGIVYHIPGTTRFQVADGIRELMRDYRRLKEEGG